MDLTVLLPEPVGPITLEDIRLSSKQLVDTATHMINLSS
jgi:hypothetical protein